MTAGFQRNIDGCTRGQLSGLLQRENFSMRLTGPLVPAFTCNPAVPDNDTTNPRIRVGGIQPAFGQPQRTLHEFSIVPVHRALFDFFLWRLLLKALNGLAKRVHISEIEINRRKADVSHVIHRQ